MGKTYRGFVAQFILYCIVLGRQVCAHQFIKLVYLRNLVTHLAVRKSRWLSGTPGRPREEVSPGKARKHTRILFLYPHEREILACGLSFGHCDHRASTNKRLANLGKCNLANDTQDMRAFDEQQSICNLCVNVSGTSQTTPYATLCQDMGAFDEQQSKLDRW